MFDKKVLKMAPIYFTPSKESHNKYICKCLSVYKFSCQDIQSLSSTYSICALLAAPPLHAQFWILMCHLHPSLTGEVILAGLPEQKRVTLHAGRECVLLFPPKWRVPVSCSEAAGETTGQPASALIFSAVCCVGDRCLLSQLGFVYR